MGIATFTARIRFPGAALEQVEQLADAISEILIEREREQGIELGPVVQISSRTNTIVASFTVEGERKGHVYAVGADTLHHLYEQLDALPVGETLEMGDGAEGSNGLYALSC